MAEAYLSYSSLTLFAMSCLTLAFSILLRLKYYRLNSFPKNLSANIFDRTFNVLDPYSESRKIIHRFLSAVLLIPFFASLVSVILFWKILESGLLLSLVIVIVCLNLILPEIVAEAYQNVKIIIKAVEGKVDFGVGDIKAFQTLKNALPKLSDYYLALSILFFAFAATFSYIWGSIIWFFTQFSGFLLEISAKTGPMGFQVALFVFALIIVIIQIFVLKIKNKFLRRVTELPI